MKIKILSDLHTEMYPFDYQKGEEDVLILAGDIGTGSTGADFANECNKQTPTLFVPGNHDYYNTHVLHTTHSKSLQSAGAMVNDFRIHNRTGFIGSTLWTGFGGNVGFQWDKYISDFRIIDISPAQMAELYKVAFRYILLMINGAGFNEAVDNIVVMTHFPLFRKSLHSKYVDNGRSFLNQYFVNDTEDIFFHSINREALPKIKLFVHGHTHSSFNYKVRGIPVICNPRGYPNRDGTFENEDFDSNLVVEL